MPKPIRHSGLSLAVRKALKEHAGKPEEWRFIIPEASDYLLGKFNLPREKLERVRMIEAHALRLQETTVRVSQGVPVTIRTARSIIQKAFEQIPGFVERNKQNLDKSQLQNLRELETSLKKDLKKLEGIPDELPTTLSQEFLKTATSLYGEELKNELGPELFEKYLKAMRKTQKVLAGRKK